MHWEAAAEAKPTTAADGSRLKAKGACSRR